MVSDSSDDMGKIAIMDTGKGIRKEDIPKVFDRFRQLESIDHHSEGTGLGMSIVFRIVEAHRGNIQVTSEPGKGTTFSVSFPQA